ncbi:MAG: 4Fe-4S dicluster domain-containing protein [Bacteroidales bacterium]|nr:4Fe-4S dicluster domain-containing protein [Bacteroidales bacterium]
MLKRVRVTLALVFLIGITLLLLDFTGVLHLYLGWMAKLQVLPALLALNVGVVAFLVVLTLVFGRVYCSVICPLGVLQDGISWLGTHKSKRPYKYKKELKWLRYGVWALFVIALVAGVQVFVALLAPYSAYGRMVQNLLQPLYLWGNNLLAWLAERAGSYAFYPREVWMRSLPTFLIAIVTLVVIVVLSFKGGRTWCNSICPVGTTLSFLSRFAMFRPVIDADQCVRCKTCEVNCKAQCISITKEAVHIDYSRCVDCFNCIDTCPKGGLKYRFAWGSGAKTPQNAPKLAEKDHSGAESAKNAPESAQRRAFLAGTAIAVGAAALKGIEARAQEVAKKTDGGFADVLPKQAPKRETPITPPGSLGARNFYRRCTGCQLCIAECPNNVLRPSTDLNHLMQPEMSFEKGYCRPECTRCGELCPSGAILPISKETKTNFHLGTAGVNTDLCLEATGKSQCGKCAQVCPTGAIMMVEQGDVRRPVVAEEVCIGCGKCEYLCPVRPISAITVNGREVHV